MVESLSTQSPGKVKQIRHQSALMVPTGSPWRKNLIDQNVFTVRSHTVQSVGRLPTGSCLGPEGDQASFGRDLGLGVAERAWPVRRPPCGAEYLPAEVAPSMLTGG